MTHADLLGPDPTLLPDRTDAQAALDADTEPAEVAAEHPDFSEAWAALAERALGADELVMGYAFARTGYHRGLDQLRRAGWKGYGPVPWSHRPNQGFLRCVSALAQAAQRIGETDEYQRCKELIDEADPAASEATGLS